MKIDEIIILHSLDGKPYFEAVEHYAIQNNIKINYYETSILKLFIRDLIKKSFSYRTIERSLKNLIFRFKVPFIRKKIIIMGTGPFDFRIIWYQKLLKNNTLILHTSHPDWSDYESMPRKNFIFQNFFKNYWISFLKNKKLKTVCVSKKSLTSMKQNFDVLGLTSQIYHTVNTTNFISNQKQKSSKFNIIFVGKFLYEKGLDTLVEIIKILDKEKYTFHIVGDGEYKSKIEYIFQRENVIYYGWVSDKKKLAKIYQKGDVFLNPSIKIKGWQELFGIVNIEAMASGLIVIASNHIGPAEIIEDEVNGFLVDEKNSLQITHIIENLYKNKIIVNKISKNAIESSQKFSIYNISKQWEKVMSD